MHNPNEIILTVPEGVAAILGERPVPRKRRRKRRWMYVWVPENWAGPSPSEGRRGKQEHMILKTCFTGHKSGRVRVQLMKIPDVNGKSLPSFGTQVLKFH